VILFDKAVSEELRNDDDYLATVVGVVFFMFVGILTTVFATDLKDAGHALSATLIVVCVPVLAVSGFVYATAWMQVDAKVKRKLTGDEV
jgi:hypothetical protein